MAEKKKPKGNVFQRMRRAEAQTREEFRASSEARNTYNRRQLPGGDMYGMTAAERGRRTWEETQGLTRPAPRRATGRSSLVDSVPEQPPRMEYSEIVPRVRSVEELANRYQAYKDPETGKMRYEYYNIIDATGEGVWQDIDEATYKQALAEAQAVIDRNYQPLR